jgi:hypothetical protein
MLLHVKYSLEDRKYSLTHSLKSMFATLFASSSLSELVFSAEVEQHEVAGAQQDEFEAGSFSAVPQQEDSALSWFRSL